MTAFSASSAGCTKRPVENSGATSLNAVRASGQNDDTTIGPSLRPSTSARAVPTALHPPGIEPHSRLGWIELDLHVHEHVCARGKRARQVRDPVGELPSRKRLDLLSVLEARVVVDDERSVRREPRVELHAVGAVRARSGERLESVLPPLSGTSPVGDDRDTTLRGSKHCTHFNALPPIFDAFSPTSTTFQCLRTATLGTRFT